MNLFETWRSCLVKEIISRPEIWNQTKLDFMRSLVLRIQKWILNGQLVPVLFHVF